jgi:hypothetical protein
MPCLALLAACGAARAEDLVITRADFPVEVGVKRTMSLANAEGRALAEIRIATIGRRILGETTLFREAVVFGQMRVRDTWVAVSDRECATYSSFDAKRPEWKCPFPLRAGQAYEYEGETGPVRVRVEGPEEIEVPGGKFTCLVCVEVKEVDGERRTQKHWIAPRAGRVKMVVEGKETYVISLARIDEPRRVVVEEGTEVLSTFDGGNMLGSPLFPRAVWSGRSGLPGRASVVEIEPLGGAAGTPFCMRWTYHAKGTWVSAFMEPSGSGERPVDLSRFGAVSFYVRGLSEGNCALTIRAKSAKDDRVIMVHIPVEVTTEWRKVWIGEKTEQFAEIDASAVYSVSFGTYAQEEDSNVIWLDEIMLHHPGQEDEIEQF